MRRRAPSAILAALLLALALAATADAHSTGTPEQRAWIRRAAGNFIAAELSGSGAGACAVLAAPLRGGDCQRHWDGRLAAMLRDPGARAGLRADRHALAGATVQVHGHTATIELPAPLLAGESRFAWTEMCWMLER
jgi:hypothetical protein